MKNTVLRAPLVAVTTAAVLLTAACSAEDEPTGTASTEQAEQTDETAAPDAEPTGPVDVPDVTILVLETAVGNLERAGLEAEVVDESGEPVDDSDLTAWQVTEQDPADGTLEPGSTVTLTVRARD